MKKVILFCTLVGGLGASAYAFKPTANPDDQYRFGWYFPPAHYDDYLKAGVNLIIWSHDSRWFGGMSPEERQADTDKQRMWIERFARDKVDYVEQVKAPVGVSRAHPELHIQKPVKRWLDVSREEAQACLREAVRESALSYTNLSAFVGIQPTTEVTLHQSWTPEFFAACEKALGFQPPREWAGTSDYTAWRKPHFPLSRIVKEDDRALVFFTWLHREWNGYNRYIDACADIFREVLGRPLFQWYDPLTRVYPLWGAIGGKNLDAGNQWYYPHPAPYGVSFVIGEEMAMLRQRPRSGVFIMLQGFSYRDYVAPKNRTPQNPPQWFVDNPNRGGVTTPGDLLVEAQWAVFSRKIEGYGIYESGAFYQPARQPRDPIFTNDKSFPALCELWRTVGVPLGPLFRAIPERDPEVVLLESHASALLAGHGCTFGWGSSEGDLLTGVNMTPYVIYEDEIKRDGLPKTAKVVVLPDCPVLTETTAKALHAFQEAGGVLVAGEWLSPDFLADVKMPKGLSTPYQRTTNAVGHRRALDRAGRELRANLAWAYRPYADSTNEDLVIHARTYRAADYVFAINDRRVCGDYIGPWGVVEEKGAPNTGVVTVRRADTAAVYDLVRHTEVVFEIKAGETEIPVSYTTCDGKVFLLSPRKLGALTIRRDGDDVVVTSPDTDVMIPIEVAVEGEKSRAGVVENGLWRRSYPSGSGLRVTNLANGCVTTVNP